MIKEIATYTGGQPVYTKDLAFLQEAFKEAIICINKSIGDTYILYGALSGTTVVEGAVVINGDVYKVTALGEIGNNKLCFRKKETSERTFRNSEKHKVYVDYEAYLSTDTSGSVAWIDLANARRANLNKIPIFHVESSGSSRYSTFEDLKKIDGVAQYLKYNSSILIRSDISSGGTYCNISASFVYGRSGEMLTCGVCTDDNSIVPVKISYDGNNTFNIELLDPSKQTRGGGTATLVEYIN